MKNLFFFLFAGMLAVAMFMGSCEKVVYPPIEIPDSVSYKTDVQAIWDAKCVSCHGGSLKPVLNPDVSYSNLINGAYVDTVNPAESELLIKLSSGSHEARASEADKQTILVWIEQGAENN